jgi:hypothetical protein
LREHQYNSRQRQFHSRRMTAVSASAWQNAWFAPVGPGHEVSCTGQLVWTLPRRSGKLLARDSFEAI